MPETTMTLRSSTEGAEMRNSSKRLAGSLRIPAGCVSGLLLAALVTVAGVTATGSSAAPAADLRLRAYATLVLADEARDQGRWEEAHASYSEALEHYRTLAKEDPKWQPEIVRYRVRYCTQQLAKLAPRLSPPDETDTLPGEPADPEEPSQAFAEKVRALTRENQYLRRRLQDLEEELDQQADVGAGVVGDGAVAGLEAELQDAEAEIEDVKAAFDAYRVDMQASVSNLQSALDDAKLEVEETRQANLDLIRQLEVAAEEHHRMSNALEAAGLEALPAREEPEPGEDEASTGEPAPVEAPDQGNMDLDNAVPL
jgi:hypothetical protein